MRLRSVLWPRFRGRSRQRWRDHRRQAKERWKCSGSYRSRRPRISKPPTLKFEFNSVHDQWKMHLNLHYNRLFIIYLFRVWFRLTKPRCQPLEVRLRRPRRRTRRWRRWPRRRRGGRPTQSNNCCAESAYPWPRTQLTVKSGSYPRLKIPSKRW